MYHAPTMPDKDRRQRLLREAVGGGRVRTQAELLKKLRAHGVRVDQSTLSRDLEELSIRKSGGVYAPADPESAEPSTPTPADYAAVVRRFTTCGPHLTVVHTVIGQAQAVAVAIDTANDPGIAGTLAGDDSIFIATRTRRGQVVALRRLRQWFGDKHET